MTCHRCNNGPAGSSWILGHLLLVMMMMTTDIVDATPFWNAGRGFTATSTRLKNHSARHHQHCLSRPLLQQSAIKEELSVSLQKLREKDDPDSVARVVRGGGGKGSVDESSSSSNLDKTVSAVLKVVTTGCRVILPPVVVGVRAVVAFYSALPIDAILAQAGLVYCFAGGYFPALFAAVQAAEQCGLQTAVHAINDLAEEAVIAIKAADLQPKSFARGSEPKKAREIFTEKTKIVLASIDPFKINQAVAGLYTTWMGISTVLQREFAKTITLSITIGDYVRPITNFVLAPPLYLCVPEQYHRWVPVVLGWACKAAAMSVAWRIQRVLTAYSSAIAGGLMFSRAMFRMLRKQGIRCFGLIPEDCEKSSVDEVLGFVVAAFGLYSQVGNGFDFKIPFPLSLVTWPFEIAERVIEWQITKDID